MYLLDVDGPARSSLRVLSPRYAHFLCLEFDFLNDFPKEGCTRAVSRLLAFSPCRSLTKLRINAQHGLLFRRNGVNDSARRRQRLPLD